MVTKKTTVELSKMTYKEIAKHIEEITQTEICKDVKYCSHIMKIFVPA